MAKVTGLAHNLYVAGYDLSGEILSLDRVGGGPTALDYTPINVSAFFRLGGLRNGYLDVTSAMDVVAGHEHTALSPLTIADAHVMYVMGSVLGNPVAVMVSKQINYDWNRDASGMLSAKVNFQSSGFGLEWGVMGTAGLRTDVAATLGTGVDDNGAASAFGVQAYLQVTGFTGTDVTIKLQDSADNVTFADVTGMAFASVVTANQAQRIASANNAALRRYVRVTTTTTGGFTSATYAVVFVRNFIAGQVF